MSNESENEEERTIDSDEFYEKYKPIYNPKHGYREGQTEGDVIGYDQYFETYGADWEYVKKQDPNLIWTLKDVNDVTIIVQGCKWVDRMNYLIASVPYTEGDKNYFLDHIYGQEY